MDKPPGAAGPAATSSVRWRRKRGKGEARCTGAVALLAGLR
ncbi:MAG: hypothetical protein ACPGC1_13470 [Pseudomonadales bacterium]